MTWGHLGRGLLLAGGILSASCGGTGQGLTVTAIRPVPNQPPTHQVVGDVVFASLGGAALTVGWMGESAIEQYFADRPGLVYPWPKGLWKTAPPTVFLIRVRNPTRQEVQFDPAAAQLISEKGWRSPAVRFEELYMLLQEVEGEDQESRLRSLQNTMLSRFVVLPPGGQREGLLIFQSVDPASKSTTLDLSTFFVGGKNVPGLFQFQILSSPR